MDCMLNNVLALPVRTSARTVTEFPEFEVVYLRQAKASPGCGVMFRVPVSHGAARFVSPGLVMDTPALGDGKLKATGTPSATARPRESVTNAPTTKVQLPSPLSVTFVSASTSTKAAFTAC